jgi:hypothetical protein
MVRYQFQLKKGLFFFPKKLSKTTKSRLRKKKKNKKKNLEQE